MRPVRSFSSSSLHVPCQPLQCPLTHFLYGGQRPPLGQGMHLVSSMWASRPREVSMPHSHCPAAHWGCRSLSTPGFLCLGGMCIPPKLAGGQSTPRVSETADGGLRVSSLITATGEHVVGPEHGIWSQETHVVGPAQTFASVTSDRSPSACFLRWWVGRHSCVRLRSERGDAVGKSGQSLGHVPGPQHLVPGASLSVSVTRCAISIHLQAPGLAGHPEHQAGPASARACPQPPGTSGFLGQPRDFHAFPRTVHQILFACSLNS